MAYLEDLWSALRPADLLDVLVVAALFYAMLSWARRARSRFVMAGLAALAGLYVVARWADLHLTLALFRAAVTVAVVALVVIFQEDLRRAFERIATVRGPLRRRRPSARDEIQETLVETLTTLAGQKTGALVVIPGQEPLERHVTEGIPLDARPSGPLLLSIFDDSSPGHDGAVLVENGRVTRFGVHLPLSTRVRGGERFGTRHTAALGLSERSDALVLVVSEERGVISLARGGELEELDAEGLEEELRSFLAAHGESAAASWWRRAFTQDLGAKALALLLAAAAWVVVVGSESQLDSRGFAVPVVLTDLPEGWMVEQPRPANVRVTLRGARRDFRDVGASDLSVRLVLAQLSAGNQRVAIRDEDVAAPQGLSIASVDPPFVSIVAHETVTRDVPVRPETSGALDRSVALRRVRSEPARVPLVLRRSEAARISSVATEPVDLGGLSRTTTLRRALVLPPGAHRAATTPSHVDVTVEVAPRARRAPE